MGYNTAFNVCALTTPGFTASVNGRVNRLNVKFVDKQGVPASGLTVRFRAEVGGGRVDTGPRLGGTRCARRDEDPGVPPPGVAIGVSPEWHQALSWGASLSIEVPRGNEQELALSDIQERTKDHHRLQAKFRTGSTPDNPVPTPTELATVSRACIDHAPAFHLTGRLPPPRTQPPHEHEDQVRSTP